MSVVQTKRTDARLLPDIKPIICWHRNTFQTIRQFVEWQFNVGKMFVGSLPIVLQQTGKAFHVFPIRDTNTWASTMRIVVRNLFVDAEVWLCYPIGTKECSRGPALGKLTAN